MVRKITDFKDGEYRVHIRDVDKDNNIVHTMLYTKGGRKYRVDVSHEFLKKFYLKQIVPSMCFDMTVIDDGNSFKFQRVYFGRRARKSAAYSKLVAKVLSEKYVSVEGFFQYNETPIHSENPIYGLLKQAQHENRMET